MNSPNPDKVSTLTGLIKEYGYEWIGTRLRKIRENQEMSIRDLADKAEVSKNSILRAEQGLPTHIATLTVICRSLKARPKTLIELEMDAAVGMVHKSSDTRWYDMATFINYRVSPMLTEQAADKFAMGMPQIPFCHIQARSESKDFTPCLIILTQPTELRSHRGDEYVMVLEGEITLEVGDQVIPLSQYEAAMFKASEFHRYIPQGDKPARLISFVFAPFRDVKNSSRPAARKIKKEN
jgi:transcriptional regulator with XRE-family HTH domain